MTEFFKPQPNFTIWATSPSPINAGQIANSTVVVTSVNGFTGTVSLNDTVPAGLTFDAISPSSITGSGTANVSCNAEIAANYTLTLTGISGSLTHSTTAIFRFQDFYIDANPASITVDAGTSAASTVAVTALNGFTSLVNLSTNSTSCNISPTSVAGSGSSTLSCNFAFGGVISIAVAVTNGSLSHSANVTYAVQDFTLTASPTSITVNTGVVANFTIQITALNGFGGTVALDTNSTWCTLTPSRITGSGNATVYCNQSVAENYTVTITGTSGTLSHTAIIVITVHPGSGSVGGLVLPTDKLNLLSQILPVWALIAGVATAGVIAVRTRVKGEREKKENAALDTRS